MSEKAQYGFLYISRWELLRLFHGNPNPGFVFPRFKFLENAPLFYFPNNLNDQLFVQLYAGCRKTSCTKIHQYMYVSLNNEINKFIKENSNIKYHTFENIINMENDYYNKYDFVDDYHDLLSNMGITNKILCVLNKPFPRIEEVD